jgi:iron complex transport system substrate-binding protein
MIALSRHALRRGFIWTLVAAIWLTFQSGPLSAATFTDSAGRQVEIPAKIERVMAAGPPAALLLYSLAPDKLIGWPHALDGRTAALLPQRYALLPVTGRITGHGNTPSAEAIAALHPDIIIDVGDVEPEYATLADRIQQQTHIPYILLDGRLANTAAIYRLLGPLLEERDKGEELAAYADRVLVLLKTKTKGGMPRLYYARGADGLSTGAVTSLTGEIIGFANAVNVAPGEKSTMKTSLAISGRSQPISAGVFIMPT